ncbi:MAG: type II secretion system protein [Gemmatimonadota bacterium]|nr:MAG: type II secretion system protein [Gemmatimonadota bacterium]
MRAVSAGTVGGARPEREPRAARLGRAVRGVFGLTLLETMVALVILGLVVLAYLEVFAGTARAQRNTEAWTQAVTYAEDGMELAKLDLQTMLARGREELEGGFGRQVASRSLSANLQLVTVTVFFPERGQFALNRLLEFP